MKFKFFSIVLGALFLFQLNIFATDYKIHSSFKKGKDNWTNIVLTGKIDQQGIIAVCQTLHKKYPNTFFHFYDDPSKIDIATKADINYPRDPYP